ncbi:MAG: hypothetical protein ACT4QF_18520 [Sporichthyaceae bacterium]
MTGMDGARAEFEATRRLLWSAAQALAGEGDPELVFDPVGLILQPADRATEWDYDATPLGATTFASTGGDGVHFSLVESPANSVIVMTVPMMWDRPNVVVGGNLQEFLSLGCRFGYFELEQLAYDLAGTAGAIQTAVEEDEVLLSELRRRLGLKPWPSVRTRLEELVASTPEPRRS